MADVLALPTDLTQEQANDCLSRLSAGLKQVEGPDVRLDASGLQRFDSAALAVLLECRRQALALGKTFSIYGLPLRLRSLAALYGIVDLLGAA